MKKVMKIILIVILILFVIWVVLRLLISIGFWNNWGSKNHYVDSLTREQTQILSEYFGLPADALREATEYCHHSGLGASSCSVSFFAQVDQDVIENLIRQYGAKVVGYDPPTKDSFPDGASIESVEIISYSSGEYVAGEEQTGGYCQIYVLIDGSGYYFRTQSPLESICFCG